MKNKYYYEVIISGSYGEGNLGDDALLIANVNLVRRYFNDIEIAIISKKANYLNKLLSGIDVYEKYDVKKVHANIFLYGGGTQFYSFKAVNYFKKLANLIFDYKKAYNVFVRKLFCNQYLSYKFGVALGVGIGPFIKNKSSKRAARAIINSLDFVAVRDEESINYCHEWGNHKAILGADLCYLSELWGGGHKERNKYDTQAIGIIVRDWPHSQGGAEYSKPLLDVAGRLIANNFQVKFILLSNCGDEGWVKILKKHCFEFDRWDPEEYDVESFVRRLSEYSIIISARYHGALFAAVSGVPVIFIEVEQKLTLASAAMGADCCLWKQPFETGDLLTIINEILDNREKVLKDMSHAVDLQIQKANEMTKSFHDFINSIHSLDNHDNK